MLIVTKTSSLLVDGDVDVLYGVFHARQARQPVMSMKHSTLGRWTVQSVHWKKKYVIFLTIGEKTPGRGRETRDQFLMT